MAVMKPILTNKILTGLPVADFARLLPRLTPVTLSAGERLSQPGEAVPYIYFPEDSVISCQVGTADGRSAELGVVGFEGAAGITAFLGPSQVAVHSLNVSVAGTALRLWGKDIESELDGDGITKSLLVYTGEYLKQVEQRATCAILHLLKQRFAVWLLLLADRTRTDVIEITQERISHCLGARRAGISVLAAEMQEAGAISCTRGSLRIIDREKLEAIACECYSSLALNEKQASYM